MGVISALVAAGTTVGAATEATAAVGDEFLTSFEQADAQPLTSTPFTDPVNVVGSTGFQPGSLLGSVVEVTASGENPPNEVATALADGSPDSKWLVEARTAEITYFFDAPVTAPIYELTSGDDAPGRDPKNFTIEGSTDGETWTLIDEQSDQAFPERKQSLRYEAAAPGAYSQYRLSITANNGERLTQLADWELLDGTDEPAPPTPMTTIVGSGPASGPTHKPRVGFSGTSSLRYAGVHAGEGPASATNVLFEDLDIEIGENTEFSYKIFPELGGDLQYPATFAAVDLVLDDGTQISAENRITDINGIPIAASAQGAEKILYADQWNSVRVDLSDLDGSIVTGILFTYDNPGGTAETAFQGWVDDIQLDPAPERIDGSSWVNYVDTRRGTNSTGSFSRGNNLPATAVPNGFNFWIPMTNAGARSWQYDYQRGNNENNLPELQGIGISHAPSPWMGDRNQIAFQPVAATEGAPDATLSARGLEFDHANEVARPELYSVLTTSGIAAEVTPTDHGSIMRYDFPDATGSVIVDRIDGASKLTIAADGTVSGWVEDGSGLSVGASRMFLSGQFDQTPTAVGVPEGNRAGSQYATFDTSGDSTVELRVATSFISQEQARANLDLEVTGRSFDDVQADAETAWNERLDVLEIEGATEDQLVTTYSSLYRLNLYPNSQFENVGTAGAPEFAYASPVAPKTGAATDTTTNAEIVSGKIYVNNGFWDTYRTVWPAYSLLYPEVAAELIDGFVQQYRDGGWVARWSSPGYADLMTGTSSDVAFADAYVKGVGTENALDTYDAALKNATVLPPNNGVGRKGLDQSIFLGYTPEETHESVSWALEGWINDFGIGNMAAKLADDPATPDERRAQLREESTYFLERAQHYTYVFDSEAGFFQPRHADGTFATPADEYDPGVWGNGYTETNGWNFAFHAPFDAPGLASLYGGAEGLQNKLTEFYATPEKADKVGSYGGVIHEMTEARDTRMGMLGMSNQVSHHIPYMSAAAGDPVTTQEKVREITQRLFVGNDIGQGYPGDEDNGETSSWFLFSALGFYPLAMGSDTYTIGSPLFTKATVHLEGRDDLVIEAPENNRDNIYVQSVSFNGEPIETTSLRHSLIADGGTLSFDMGAEASGWAGEDPEDVAVPTHQIDALHPNYGSLVSSDETPIAAITDDNSRSEVTFLTAEPQLTWTSNQGPVTVASYTITNGAAGAAPSAWTLEGSSDGETWVAVDERTDQAFPWGSQTRPFQIEQPRALAYYRLSLATADGTPPTIAEVELLADAEATAGDLALAPRTGLATEAGVELAEPIATLSGVGDDASMFDATVDYLDGGEPVAATLTQTPLGAWDVAAPHTFTEPGRYDARVTATDGVQMTSTVVTIDVTRTAPSLVSAFDSVCLAQIGQAGNCDQLGNAFSRRSLAESGFIQGTQVAVPGTALTFDLSDIEPGQPDNATGRGQTIPLALGDDVTQLSVIGSATEKPQDTVGVLTFDDGSTLDIPIQFGDWTASVATPAFGNIQVGLSLFRMNGANEGDPAGSDAAIFSTAPFALPEGRTAVSLTLPTQGGDPRADGRIHVFAIATDGTRLEVPGIAVTAAEPLTATVDEPLETALGVVSGGDPVEGYTVSVNWGDGTGAQPVEVSAEGEITGTHTYATAGEFAVTIVADDGSGSATAATTVTVSEKVGYETSLTLVSPEPVAPGESVGVTGAGFEPGETVTVALAAAPEARAAAGATVVADEFGGFTTSVTVPEGAADGSYPISAIGEVSNTEARTSVRVEAGAEVPVYTPELRVLAESALRGEAVGVEGTGFAAGETVTMTLFSAPLPLGTLVANADGVIAGEFIVPAEAVTGAHEVEALGAASQVAARVAFAVVDLPPGDGGTGPAAPGWDGLPSTGQSSEQPAFTVLGAVVLLLTGAAALLVAVWQRRRRQA